MLSCDTGNLTVVADLPKALKEASGIETTTKSDLIWMLNDGGNPPKLYGINTKGNIKKELDINAKNNDWEDLTTDDEGNLYIGDFGNNANKRKNLVILKVSHSDLKNKKNITAERITFEYENQKKFSPKKEKMHFDCEAFLHYNDSLFLFTKSRANKDFGKTNLYKIPAKKGHHKAQLISSFNTCDEAGCWITSVDINDDTNKIALLTENSVFIFSDFKKNDFFNGKVKRFPFNYNSQKESVCFKNDSTLYITDERTGPKGGNLYEFSLD